MYGRIEYIEIYYWDKHMNAIDHVLVGDAVVKKFSKLIENCINLVWERL
jgi:hypothetical protein